MFFLSISAPEILDEAKAFPQSDIWSLGVCLFEILFGKCPFEDNTIPRLMFQIQNKPFFGLPGNPVAVMVSFINFVEPALRKMQGEQGWQPLKVNAIATESLRSRQGRTEFSRGIYELDHRGQLTVRTTGKQGSGILRSMSEANCLIEISPAIDTVKVGESVTIIPLQGRI